MTFTELVAQLYGFDSLRLGTAITIYLRRQLQLRGFDSHPPKHCNISNITICDFLGSTPRSAPHRWYYTASSDAKISFFRDFFNVFFAYLLLYIDFATRCRLSSLAPIKGSLSRITQLLSIYTLGFPQALIIQSYSM